MKNYRKLQMGKIDYINASPVYYGLDHGLVPDWIDMIEGPPAILNGMIKRGELEISPISAAFYGMNHRELMILPDLSISCHEEVMSVILMSDYEIEDLDGRNIVLTRDSATAASLVKLVAAEKGIKPVFTTGKLRSLADVPEDADAAMIIGDAAMTQPWEERFRYRVDLGKLWKETTGMPFVFALWVVRRDAAVSMHDEVAKALELFYESRQRGYENIDAVIAAGSAKLGLTHDYVRRYFEMLHCNLDAPKIDALSYFFDSLYKHSIFSDRVELSFF